MEVLTTSNKALFVACLDSAVLHMLVIALPIL